MFLSIEIFSNLKQTTIKASQKSGLKHHLIKGTTAQDLEKIPPTTCESRPAPEEINYSSSLTELSDGISSNQSVEPGEADFPLTSPQQFRYYNIH